MSRDPTWPRGQRVMWLHGWVLLIISHCPVKLGGNRLCGIRDIKLLNYHVNSPVMSDDPLLTWSWEVTWLIQSLVSPLPQGLWLLNMTGCWLMLRRTYLGTHMILWQSDDVWSRDKLSCLARPMAIELGKLMIYGEINPPIKSHVFLPPGYIRSRGKLKTE